MGEILPDGSIQSEYVNYCPSCRSQVTVNIQGQGNCENCGYKLDPIEELKEEK